MNDTSARHDGNVAQDGSSGLTAEGLFDQALVKLRTGLSDADRSHIKEFRNHTDMITSLQMICSSYVADKRRLFQFAKRIETFASAFAPFFDVVGVYVSIKPEWAAWFWGSLWLIFKLGSNFVSFFDRVTEMLEEMAMILPQYEAWFSVCRQTQAFTNKSRLSQSLGLIYSDFIDYIVHIYFVFTRRSKGRLGRTLLVSELMLRPFSSRFSQLQERIDKHRVWFETEAKIEQHKLVDKLHGDFQRFIEFWSKEEDVAKRVASQRAENLRRFREIKLWIKSSDYQSLYEIIRDAIHPGSGTGFIQIREYVRLKDSTFTDRGNEDSTPSKDWFQQLVFLCGKPGLGKTFSSVRIADDLKDSLPPTDASEDRPNVVFYHYSQIDRFKNNELDGALRAIAEQLVHANRDDQLTLDALSMIQMEHGSGQHVASLADIRAVVNLMLRRHPTFIIIDGVDECNEPIQLLEEVRRVCIETDCRVILLGRPSTPIPPRWSLYQSEATWKIELEPSIVFSDISILIESHLREMVAMKLFGPRVHTLNDLLGFTAPDLVEELRTTAEGMLLWARLLINLLHSPAMSVSARLEILRQPSALVSLDTLYCRILNALEMAGEHEQKITQKVFQWLLYSTRPLNVTVVHTALAVQLGRSTIGEDYLSNYPECIPRITCSLVELHKQRNSLVFLHKTFKSFLLQRVWNPPLAPSDLAYLGSGRSRRRAGRGLLGDLDYLEGTWGQSRESTPGYHTRQELPGSVPMVAILNTLSATSRRDRPDPLNNPEDTYGQSQESSHGYRERRELAGSASRRSIIFDNLAANSSHLYLAMTCLSYLVHNVPARPLSRPTRDEPNCSFRLEAASESREATNAEEARINDESSLQDKDVQYPLLSYSAMCWVHHLVRAHSEDSGHDPASLKPERMPLNEDWISLLSKFLLNRLTVTMWTELSYRYRLSPSVEGLMPLARYLRNSGQHCVTMHSENRSSGVYLRERAWVGQGLRTLSEALKSLAHRYNATLLRNPALIWKDEIQDAQDRYFWPSWPEEEEWIMSDSAEEPTQHSSWRVDHDNPPTPSVG